MKLTRLRHLIPILMILSMCCHSGAIAATEAYGLFGFEEKHDVFPGTNENAMYFGADFNFNETWEIQGMIAAESPRNHLSFNYHHRFFNSLQPFGNVGVGVGSGLSPHLNIDLGFQYNASSLKFRIFHKTQNVLWGANQGSTGAILIAIGKRI